MVEYTELFIAAINKYQNHTKWLQGSFKGIKTVSNTSVGSVGQSFIESLCVAHSLRYATPKGKDGSDSKQSPWDLEI